MINFFAKTLERWDTRLLIFSTLCLNYLSLKLDENEEEYFAFAKYFMNPDWIPDASSVSDVPGTRIIIEAFIGLALKHLSFEQVAFIGRGIGALLISFPLARIFHRLRFSNLEVFFFIQLICLFPHQSFFGKEWIFGAFETKTIAYVFVFYSFHSLLEGQHRRSVLLAAIAVYFHILVGGWYAVILFIYFLFSRVGMKRLLQYGLLFTLMTAPFVTYLAINYLQDNPSIINGVNINWVYVYFRNPHHLAPFNEQGEIGKSFLRGIIVSLVIFVVCLRNYRSQRKSDLDRLALFFMVAFGQQALFLIVAYFDTQGVVLKYYPFRSSALSFFTALLMLFLALRGKGERIVETIKSRLPIATAQPLILERAGSAFFLILLIGLGVNLSKNLHASVTRYFPDPEESAKESLYTWIYDHTPPDAMFLNLNRRKRDDLDFVRRTGRDRFSVFKFVPTRNDMIYDWYQRVREKERVMNDPGYLFKLKERYSIDYVISRRALDEPGLRHVYGNDHYYLYALSRLPGKTDAVL